MKLSTVILTRNEERQIGRSIESAEFSDEILVIDDFSTDRTTELARRLGALVFQRKLNGDFGAQRNFGLEKSRGDWILFLDADEFLSPELQVEIKKIISEKEEFGAYYIKRRDYMWGRELLFGELRDFRNTGLIRLVKKNSGKWYSSVHEVFKSTFPVSKLKYFINHNPHQTIGEFLNEINFYSTLRARELHHRGERPSLFKILAFPVGKFLRNYFIRFGFLDNSIGFVYAFMMSFHSFLVRAKLYQYAKLYPKKGK